MNEKDNIPFIDKVYENTKNLQNNKIENNKILSKTHLYNIHQNIKLLLDNFIRNNNIPNIIFHGENGSGKKTILQYFLNRIYKTIEDKKDYIMCVNCSYGKGIKFIREELKFFAKTNIHTKKGTIIKSIVLLNADELTIEAQTALRRCIELFSNNTRFFIVIENKHKLIKPIISRFCDIYIPLPCINEKETNLHTLKKMNFNDFTFLKKHIYLKTIFQKLQTDKINTIEYSKRIYEKGISCIDIIHYIKLYEKNDIQKYKVLLSFDTVKDDIKNEKLMIYYILNIYLMRNDIELENIYTL